MLTFPDEGWRGRPGASQPRGYLVGRHYRRGFIDVARAFRPPARKERFAVGDLACLSALANSQCTPPWPN
jgi:hypothetical protein